MPRLTTTTYGVLGLLAVRPHSTYELAKAMDRSVGRVWPRAQSKLFEEPKKQPEPVDKNYPLLLLTGRGSSSQWHTGTRTNKSPVLCKLFSNQPYVEVSPQDARQLELAQNEWVVVESRRAQVTARVFISHVVQPGQCFMPMHYAKTNQLTFPSFDAYSRQPSYKNCAVRLRRKSDVPGAE